jgi:hypothetical protein
VNGVVVWPVRMRRWSPTAGWVWALWAWTGRDPLAVTVEVALGLEWTLARALLRQGLTRPAGLGAVQVFPHRGAVAVGLYGPGVLTLYTARRRDLGGFLTATYLVVPDGEERVDVDAAIARVLGEVTRG